MNPLKDIAECIAALNKKHDEIDAAFIEAYKSLQNVITFNDEVEAENAAFLRKIRHEQKLRNEASYQEEKAKLQQQGIEVTYRE